MQLLYIIFSSCVTVLNHVKTAEWIIWSSCFSGLDRLSLAYHTLLTDHIRGQVEQSVRFVCISWVSRYSARVNVRHATHRSWVRSPAVVTVVLLGNTLDLYRPTFAWVLGDNKRSKLFDKSRIAVTKPNASSFPEIGLVLLPCNFTDEDKKPSCRWGTVRARCQLKSGKILHKCSTDCNWKGLQTGNDLQRHSRSLTLVPFNRPHTISY